MTRLQLLSYGLCVLFCGCSAQPPRPMIEFRRLAWQPENEYGSPPQLVAEFRVANRGGGSLWYTGYGDKPLTVARDRFGAQWLEFSDGRFCGNGLKSCELRPGRSVPVALRPQEGADAVQVGVRLSANRATEGDIVWGAPQPTSGAPPPPAVSVPDSPCDRARALLHAAGIGYVREVRAILGAGVDVNARPARPDGRSPCAYPGGGWDNARVNWTALHAAAEGAHGEVVELLIAAGGEVDADDGCGGTPLVYAVRRGDSRSARALLAAGANPNATLRLPDIPDGPEGLRETPLHVAARYGRRDLAAALVAAGADVNARDGWGRTPIDLGAERAPRDATPRPRS